MNIGILGAGNIGGNLGRRWAAQGHTVRFGVRKADELAALVKECGHGASAGDPRSAAAHGEVVVLALPWAAVAGVLQSVGDMKGKIVVDATNALQWGADGPEPAVDTSAAQKIAEMCPGARVVKAFNTLGAEHILNPKVGGLPADVFLCTDDAPARETVKKLAEEIGFHAVSLGPLRNARVAEHIGIAWIYLAMKGGLGRNIAFKVLGGV
jgi:NADPH-dependent F420 reductase